MRALNFHLRSFKVHTFEIEVKKGYYFQTATSRVRQVRGKMKKIHSAIMVIAVSLLTIGHQNLAANLPLAQGGVLPGISLSAPNDPDEKSYSGISGSGFFRIPQIKAEVVIIEIFSMYCRQCQEIAPGMDELYHLIESNPDLKNKIKLIGIGAGNSRYKVEVFKKPTIHLFRFFRTTSSPSIKPWERSDPLTSLSSKSIEMERTRWFIQNWIASKKHTHFWS
jgi:hypothetical protein